MYEALTKRDCPILPEIWLPLKISQMQQYTATVVLPCAKEFDSEHSPHIWATDISLVKSLPWLASYPGHYNKNERTNDLGMRLHLGPLQSILEQWAIMTGTECHKILTFLIQNSETIAPNFELTSSRLARSWCSENLLLEKLGYSRLVTLLYLLCSTRT